MIRSIAIAQTPTWLLCVVLLLGSAACGVRMVAPYDPGIDRVATELQVAMDVRLTNLEAIDGQRAAYAEHAPFYREYAVRLRSLRLRVEAHEHNELTLQQLDRINDSLEELRSVHAASGTVSAGFLTLSRELFNTSWGAIIAWEIAKLRR